MGHITKRKRKEFISPAETRKNIINNIKKKLKNTIKIKHFDYYLSNSHFLKIPKIENSFKTFNKKEEEPSSKTHINFIRYLKSNKTKKNILNNKQRFKLNPSNYIKIINEKNEKILNNINLKNECKIENDEIRITKINIKKPEYSSFNANESINSSKDSDKLEESFKTLIKIGKDKIEQSNNFIESFYNNNKEEKKHKITILNNFLNIKPISSTTKNIKYPSTKKIRIIKNKPNLFHNHILIKKLY